MSVEVPISKENLNHYLSELGKRFRKLSGKKMPAEIILIGGASILINYGFRDVTYDADAIIFASSVMREAINYVRDEFGLPHEWLNEGFKNTSSYSDKLFEVSVYYRSFSNVLIVRTITAEYLIAMKAMSGRQYKYDLSDIVGIIWEHEKNGKPISRGDIDNAVTKLYGAEPLPDISQQLLDDVFATENYDFFYKQIRDNEKESKAILVEFDRNNPGMLKGENINNIINTLRNDKLAKNKNEEV